MSELTLETRVGLKFVFPLKRLIA